MRGKVHRSNTAEFCGLCGLKFTSKKQLQEHREGKRHREAEIKWNDDAAATRRTRLWGRKLGPRTAVKRLSGRGSQWGRHRRAC